MPKHTPITHANKKRHRNLKKIFSLPTTRLSPFLEGLNKSLTKLTGELWPWVEHNPGQRL